MKTRTIRKWSPKAVCAVTIGMLLVMGAIKPTTSTSHLTRSSFNATSGVITTEEFEPERVVQRVARIVQNYRCTNAFDCSIGQAKPTAQIDYDARKGLMILNQLVLESFGSIGSEALLSSTTRTAKRRRFLRELPSLMGRVMRGLTNLTVSIGRTINSENVNGSLSRLITSRLVGVSESLMGWVERSVDDLPSIPRMDAQECMKRCICEAHNQPKKYGAVGLVIQLFFPPYLDAEDVSKIVSKYQLAARYGRSDNANCASQYDGCMVNILDVFQGAINMVF